MQMCIKPVLSIRKSITTANPFEINRFTVFPSITVLVSTLISRNTWFLWDLLSHHEVLTH